MYLKLTSQIIFAQQDGLGRTNRAPHIEALGEEYPTLNFTNQTQWRKKMNSLFKLVFTTTIILMLSGCGEPTFDTSSDETIKESLQEIIADLSKDDQERFKKTLTSIYMFGALANFGDNAEDTKEKINSILNGKTADEIFQFANELKQKVKK